MSASQIECLDHQSIRSYQVQITYHDGHTEEWSPDEWLREWDFVLKSHSHMNFAVVLLLIC